MTDKQIIIDGEKITKEDFIDYFSIELTNRNVDERKEIGDKYFEIILAKEQECEELKIQIKEHNDDMFKNPPEKRFYCKGCTLPYISKKQSQTLTEIKEIAEKNLNIHTCAFKGCGYDLITKQILQKISEVENE